MVRKSKKLQWKRSGIIISSSRWPQSWFCSGIENFKRMELKLKKKTGKPTKKKVLNYVLSILSSVLGQMPGISQIRLAQSNNPPPKKPQSLTNHIMAYIPQFYLKGWIQNYSSLPTD